MTAAGDSLKPFLPKLIPALVGAAGELESAKLSYLSTALADTGTRELLDDMRASAARHHYTTDTVVKARTLYNLFHNLCDINEHVVYYRKSFCLIIVIF